MTRYTTPPGRFAEIQTQLLLKTVPMWLLAGGGGYAMSVYNSGRTLHQEADVLPLFLLLMAGALGFGLYRSLALQKRLYESYALTITEEHITREQHNTPAIALPLRAITRITRNHNGTFTIQGSTPRDVIGVYKQIEPYDALETHLNAVCPVTVQAREPWGQKLRIPVVLFTLGLLAIVYVAAHKLLVGGSGLALSGLLLWTFFHMQQNPNLDRTTKRLRWGLVPVLLSIIATTLIKLLAK